MIKEQVEKNQMTTLKKQYEQLEKWDYYKRGANNTVRKIDDWKNRNEHKKFIAEFLKISGKDIIKDTFENINDTNLEKFERLDHINSVFFLGCLFYQNTIFKDRISFYRKDDMNKERDEFYFIWFLTSLVHDFGYKLESNIPKGVNNNINSFREYSKDKAVHKYYNLLDEVDKYEISPNLYTLLENVPNYYAARMDGKIGRNAQAKIDHGIAAGLILFNSLKHIRINKLDELKSFGIDNCVDEQTNLYWCDDLDEFYFIASSSIAVHNMRRVSRYDSDYEEQKKLYQHYRMDALVLDEDKIKKLSIEDEPFLFLFSIVDTIEPTKIFKCQSAEYVLENICIDFTNQNTIIIKKVTGADLNFQKLIDKVDGLDNWLNIEKPICTNDSITIIIKENEVQ